MKLRNLFSIFAVIASFGAGHAQDSFSQVILSILDNNSELQSQRELITAQRLENSDANALSNPEVSFARVWGRHGIGNKLQLDVSQSFDWPGLYRVRSLAANQGISAAEMMVLSSELDIAIEAKTKLVELIYLRRQIKLSEDLLNTIKSLKQSVDNGVEKGEITILDQRKLMIEQYKMETSLAELYSQNDLLESQLQAMNNGQELALNGIDQYPVEPMLGLPEYQRQITELDPLISAQQFTIMQEDYNARAATASRFPSFSIGYQHQAEMGDRFNGFTVSMTLPFFENRKAKGVALARREATSLSAQMLLAQKQAEISSLYKDMLLWRKSVEDYNRVFGDNQYLNLLKRAFDAGHINVIDYLTEVHYYDETAFSCLEAEYKYQNALAQLNKYSLLNLYK